MRLLLTGGGTAGHINPALAIAETVRKNDPHAEILFVGIKTGKEADLVPREGYQIEYVESMGIPRRDFFKNPRRSCRAIWLALTSPYQKNTVRILKDFRPDAVIGTGGYACWPIMSAAARMGIPTALHESNALPGMAICRLQKKVDRIWINFEVTRQKLRTKKPIVCVGNPLRGGFGGLSRSEARARLCIPSDAIYILSFGGSLGAEELNRAVIDMMEPLSQNVGIYLLHGSGTRDYEACQALLEQRGLDNHPRLTVRDYIFDMPLQMTAADLVISRAGAMTLSELASMGKASILVPSPYVADNHQFHNAKALADVGAALLVEEKDLSGGGLTAAVESLLQAPEKRTEMERHICELSKPHANREIYEQLLEMIRS